MKKIFFCIAFLLIAAFAYSQNIVSAEYYFDTDPGIGNGISYPVTASDSVSLNINIPTGSLSPGFHKLYFRFKNISAQWSLAEGRTFYLQRVVGSQMISEAEYFFDTDPGVGNGLPVTVSNSSDSVTIIADITAPGIPAGNHYLYIRVKNASGSESL